MSQEAGVWCVIDLRLSRTDAEAALKPFSVQLRCLTAKNAQKNGHVIADGSLSAAHAVRCVNSECPYIFLKIDFLKCKAVMLIFFFR